MNPSSHIPLTLHNTRGSNGRIYWKYDAHKTGLHLVVDYTLISSFIERHQIGSQRACFTFNRAIKEKCFSFTTLCAIAQVILILDFEYPKIYNILEHRVVMRGERTPRFFCGFTLLPSANLWRVYFPVTCVIYLISFIQTSHQDDTTDLSAISNLHLQLYEAQSEYMSQ